jgi:GxxExxY protein
MSLNEITEQVIGAAIEVHRALGPGLLESTYEGCLAHELALRQIPFERQKAIPLAYKGVNIDAGFRVDFLVADRVVVEIKAVDAILPIHEAQVLTYLKLADLHAGLLINFNVRILTKGVRRLVNGPPSE